MTEQLNSVLVNLQSPSSELKSYQRLIPVDSTYVVPLATDTIPEMHPSFVGAIPITRTPVNTVYSVPISQETFKTVQFNRNPEFIYQIPDFEIPNRLILRLRDVTLNEHNGMFGTGDWGFNAYRQHHISIRINGFIESNNPYPIMNDWFRDILRLECSQFAHGILRQYNFLVRQPSVMFSNEIVNVAYDTSTATNTITLNHGKVLTSGHALNFEINSFQMTGHNQFEVELVGPLVPISYTASNTWNEASFGTPQEQIRHRMKNNVVRKMVQKKTQKTVIPITNNAAENKARDTLHDMLIESDWRRYVTNGFIMVKGQSGMWYQVFRGGQGRIRVYKDGKAIEEICIHTDSACPPTDHVISMKIMLEIDEDAVRKGGNISKLTPANLIQPQPKSIIQTDKPRTSGLLVEAYQNLKKQSEYLRIA